MDLEYEPSSESRRNRPKPVRCTLFFLARTRKNPKPQILNPELRTLNPAVTEATWNHVSNWW